MHGRLSRGYPQRPSGGNLEASFFRASSRLSPTFPILSRVSRPAKRQFPGGAMFPPRNGLGFSPCDCISAHHNTRRSVSHPRSIGTATVALPVSDNSVNLALSQGQKVLRRFRHVSTVNLLLIIRSFAGLGDARFVSAAVRALFLLSVTSGSG